MNKFHFHSTCNTIIVESVFFSRVLHCNFNLNSNAFWLPTVHRSRYSFFYNFRRNLDFIPFQQLSIILLWLIGKDSVYVNAKSYSSRALHHRRHLQSMSWILHRSCCSHWIRIGNFDWIIMVEPFLMYFRELMNNTILAFHIYQLKTSFHNKNII